MKKILLIIFFINIINVYTKSLDTPSGSYCGDHEYCENIYFEKGFAVILFGDYKTYRLSKISGKKYKYIRPDGTNGTIEIIDEKHVKFIDKFSPNGRVLEKKDYWLKEEQMAPVVKPGINK